MTQPSLTSPIGERAHELRKAVVLLSYASWCEEHAGDADTRSVMAVARRVLQKAEEL